MRARLQNLVVAGAGRWLWLVSLAAVLLLGAYTAWALPGIRTSAKVSGDAGFLRTQALNIEIAAQATTSGGSFAVVEAEIAEGRARTADVVREATDILGADEVAPYAAAIVARWDELEAAARAYDARRASHLEIDAAVAGTIASVDDLLAALTAHDEASERWLRNTILGGMAAIVVMASLTSAVLRWGGRRMLRLERQLASAAAEETSILEMAPDPIIVIDERGAIVQANAATARVFGWELSELAGRNVAMLAGGDLAEEQHDRYLAHFIDTGEASTEKGLVVGAIQEVVGRCKDGSEFPMELMVAEVASSGGPRNFTAVIRDVTDRVAAHEALRESENRYRAMFEGSLNGAVVVDGDGIVLACNVAFQELVGYTVDELVGQSSSLYDDPADLDLLAARRAARLEGKSVPARYFKRLIRRDGSVAEVEASAALIEDSDRTVGILISYADLTEQIRMREQMLQSQKREAVGTLVAGVAHDFNNLLTVIDGGIYLAQGEGTDSQWLEKARVATHRAADLVKQLLLTSRPGDGTRVEMDLARLARETVGLVRQTFDRRIDIQLDVPQEPVRVWADGGQLHQVLMNLLVNARDAVGEAMGQAEDGSTEYQPRITLTVTRGEQPEGRETDYWAELTLRDNGVGMPRAVRERIFDPFFTTKEVGEGTGLGLSTAYGIVSEHGGTITIDSAPGEGATFIVRLPALATRLEPDGASLAEPSQAERPGLRRRLLLVDDEPTVIEVANQMLASAGYDVVCATGGGMALKLAVERPFDLVLLDVNMPSPNGWQTLHELLKDQPHLRVLMFSGYALEDEARERGATGLLRKPFDRETLVGAVDEALAV